MSDMPIKNSFIDGEVGKEFDHIIRDFVFLLTSSIIISIGIYAIAYAATIKADVAGIFFILIGILFYLFIGGVGLSTIKGFLIAYGYMKERAESSEQRKKRDRNVHLSLSLFLTVITVVFAAFFIGASKSSLTGFNVSAFIAIVTIIPIADSIFVALIGNQLIRYGKRALAIYQVLIVDILISLATLIIIGLGGQHVFILLGITASIFSMYYLFSIFLYYTKLLLKDPKKFGVAGI